MKILHIMQKPVASFESEAIPQEDLADVISDSTAEVAALETEATNELEADERTSASLEAAIEALEALRPTLVGRPVSSMEMSLALPALCLAVRGTDIDVAQHLLGHSEQRIASSFESEGVITVSTEAFGETLKNMGSAALENLKKAGQWLYELLVKIFNVFRSHERRIKNMKAGIEAAAKDSKYKSGDKMRMTGAQASNVGTADQYVKFVDGVLKLKNKEGEFVALLDIVKKSLEGIKGNERLGFKILDKQSIGNLMTALAKVVDVYQDVLDSRVVSKGDQNVIESTVVGKRKITLAWGKVANLENAIDAYTGFTSSVSEKENSDKEVMVDVLNLDDLKKVVAALEKAVSEKMTDLGQIKKLANHIFWKTIADKTGMINHTGSESAKEILTVGRKLASTVDKIAIKPQSRIYTLLSSVTGDYMRYVEKSINAHLKGAKAASEGAKGEAKEGELVGPGTGLATV